MGRDRGVNSYPEETKILDDYIAKALVDIGVDLKDLLEFWRDYVHLIQDKFTASEAFLRLKHLEKYKNKQELFDYFGCYGLVVFTKRIIKDKKNADCESE